MSNKQLLKIRELDPDIIAPSTSKMHLKEQGGSKTVIIGKPGCFKKYTKVLMYDGSVKNIQDIEVGELVMGDDSTPRKVLELFRNRDKMFDIITMNGGKYNVNLLHDLVIVDENNNVVEISVKDFLEKDTLYKKSARVMKTQVYFPEKELDVEPYDLGMFLKIDKTNIEQIQMWKNLPEKYKKYENIDRIPHNYLINSEQNRLQLLAGILDIDGYYNLKRHSFDIYEKKQDFVGDIVFLTRSLGFVANVKKYIRQREFSYRITIYGDVQRIPSKNIKYPTTNTDKDYLLSPFFVKYTGYDDYYGFSLDGNKRFVLASFDIVRNTGKSTLITSLLYEKSHIFPTGVVMSGTEDSNHHYSQIFPSTFVYNRLEKDRIEDFIKRQKIAKDHLDNAWSVLLLDDCTDDPKLFNDTLFQGIFKNGRHWKMWFILSLQYCMDVKPVIRTNIDGTFILRETNMKNRKSLWENYAGVIPDFTMFCNIMDQITTDYTALYIHNATTSNNIEDCVFWYKARQVPKSFKFGSDEYWRFHNKRYDDTYTRSII